MRILLASSSSGSRGGGEIYLLYLGRELAALEHQPVLWCSRHPRMDALAREFGEFAEVVRDDYTNTYDLRLRSLAALWRGGIGRRLAENWRRLEPDVVHVNKQNLEDGLELLAAADACGLPRLCTIHLTQSARYLRAQSAWPRDWVARRLLRRFGGEFIAVQEQRSVDLERFLGGGGERIHSVHNGVPVPDAGELDEARQRQRRQLGIGERELLVVGLGRLMPQKRPQLFLDLAARIRGALPQARFLWLGSGWLDDRWQDWVGGRGLADCVERIPWTRDVAAHLAAADVFLHTAQYEGMPLALFEAMACGLPCLLTPNLLDDMPFLPADCVLPVDGDWLDALRDRGRLAAIGRRARSLVSGTFSTRRMALATLDVYAAARGRRHPQATP